MTTETSNARGEWVLVPRETLERVTDGIFSKHLSAKESEDVYDTGYFGAMLKDLEAMLDAAPPPAAARGDVRGLVSLAKRVQYADDNAQVANDEAGEFICLPPWLWLEIRDAAAEALAALTGERNG